MKSRGFCRWMVAGEWLGAGEIVAMRFIQVTLLLVFLAAVAIFALENNKVVEVQFLGWKRSPPLAALIVGVYLLGMVSGGAVLGFIRRSIRVAAERPRVDTQL